MSTLNYDEKLAIANKYLNDVCGLCWYDLADINSLHDVDTEEDIKMLCNDRLEEAGFHIDNDE